MTTNNSSNQNSSGLQVYSSGTFTGRTLTGTANQVSISNGDGGSGNPTVALTSTIYVSGISFDSGSNTLSIYTSGTYNPTIDASTGSPTVSYGFQTGYYQKIGTKVYVNAAFSLSSLSGGSGALRLSLPFASSATANSMNTSPVNMQNTTKLRQYQRCQTSVGNAWVNITGCTSATADANETVAELTSTSSFNFSHMYNI